MDGKSTGKGRAGRGNSSRQGAAVFLSDLRGWCGQEQTFRKVLLVVCLNTDRKKPDSRLSHALKQADSLYGSQRLHSFTYYVYQDHKPPTFPTLKLADKWFPIFHVYFYTLGCIEYTSEWAVNSNGYSIHLWVSCEISWVLNTPLSELYLTGVYECIWACNSHA